MNMIANQPGSIMSVNRVRPLLVGLSTAEPHAPVTRTIQARSRRMTTMLASRPTTARAHSLVSDADSSDLGNFLFAFTAFVLLGTGRLAARGGMVDSPLPLA